MQYIMAIDQGTTSTTVIIVDKHWRLCAASTREFPQVYPHVDWVEHRPDDIWQSVLEAIGSAVARARIDVREIIALGVTNQRESTIIWERETGQPIYNAIVWQCLRTTDKCQELRDAGLEPMISEKTGLLCNPYFSATKIRWILDRSGRQADAEAGKLCFGTIDSYLLWQLTGGKAHVTDASNASRTLLMNLETLDWDEDLLKLFNLPKAILPRICDNAEVYAHTWRVPGLPDGIPIAGMAGDQQAALFGQSCFDVGTAKCTFGTGAFLLVNTGNKIVRSRHGLLSTCAWKLGTKVSYALEGSVFVAGALVHWLRDGLGILKESDEIEALARSVEDSNGVTIVPALTGLGAPHWRPEVKGSITGLTRATNKAHIARAALNGICHQTTDLLEAMAKDLGTDIKFLKVDGGASVNNLLMQIQADLFNCHLERPEILQTTALGAAMLAALGIGMYHDVSELRLACRNSASFDPMRDDAWRVRERKTWAKAIS